MEPLGFLLIGCELLFPLLDVGRGLEQSGRQLGVVPLERLQLGLPVFTDAGGTGGENRDRGVQYLEPLSNCDSVTWI